jgi:hypothetical protein
MANPSGGRSVKSFLQIMYFMLLGSVGVYWLVMGMVPARRQTDLLANSVLKGLAALAAIIFFYVRFVLIERLLAGAAADDGVRVARLRQSWILCYTLADAVALCGFAAYFLGGGRGRSALFSLAAVGLFLMCYPRLPKWLNSRD